MAIGRRRLFGLLAGAPPAAVAALSASLAAPEVAAAAPDPASFVSFHTTAVLRPGQSYRKFDDPQKQEIRRNHVCQCTNCVPGLELPSLKVLSREYIVPFADQGDTAGYWREEYEALHDGHFGVRVHRPTYQDWGAGVRLKVWVDGRPIRPSGITEVIAGPNGRVWFWTEEPLNARHVCLSCHQAACLTMLTGEVKVDVMVPEGVELQAPLRAIRG